MSYKFTGAVRPRWSASWDGIWASSLAYSLHRDGRRATALGPFVCLKGSNKHDTRSTMI